MHAELAGLAQDRVVNIGDIADAAGLVAEIAEPTLQDVVAQVGRRVTEVGGVVRRDPTGVDRHHRTDLERDDLLRSRVVQAHGRST